MSKNSAYLDDAYTEEAGWRWLGDMASEDWAALPLDEIARGVLKAAQEVRAAR